MLRLTNLEILKAFGENVEGDQLDSIAVAQLKKVVELIRTDKQFTDELEDGETGECMVCFSRELWDSILKEVE